MNNQTNYQTTHLDNLLQFIEKNIPTPQHPWEEIDRQFLQFRELLWHEVNENLIQFTGIWARKYKDWLVERLQPSLRVVSYGILVETLKGTEVSFLPVDTLSRRERLQKLAQEGFRKRDITGNEKDYFAIYELIRDTWEICSRAQDDLYSLERYVEEQYELGRRLQYLGNGENRFDLCLLRDYEEVLEEGLEDFTTGSFLAEDLPRRSHWAQCFSITRRNLEEEILCNYFRLATSKTQPYQQYLYSHYEGWLRRLLDLPALGEERFFPRLSSRAEVSPTAGQRQWQEMRAFLCEQLLSLLDSVESHLREQENTYFEHDVDEEPLSLNQRLLKKILMDDFFLERYATYREEVLEELAFSWYASEIEVSARLDVLADPSQWTQEDHEDEDYVFSHLSRWCWVERYEEYPEF